VLPATRVAPTAVRDVLQRDATVHQTLGWLGQQSRESRVASNGIEAASRFRTLMYLRGDRTWTEDRLFYVPPGTPVGCRGDYLIELDDQGSAGVPDLGPVVRHLPTGRIYAVQPFGGCP
jgi:hypothetical protein